MKVKELISHLEKFDQEAKVLIGDYTEVGDSVSHYFDNLEKITELCISEENGRYKHVSSFTTHEKMVCVFRCVFHYHEILRMTDKLDLKHASNLSDSIKNEFNQTLDQMVKILLGVRGEHFDLNRLKFEIKYFDENND